MITSSSRYELAGQPAGRRDVIDPGIVEPFGGDPAGRLQPVLDGSSLAA